jgi:MFS family permease
VGDEKTSTAESTAADTSGLRLIVRALRHRNYRLFFAGQGISLIGTWMQRIAMGWLVYRLTHSPFLLGIVGFAGLIPTFILTPFAGVLTDRWSRHRILVVTQSLAMVQALVLAGLVLTGAIAIWQIIGLSIFLGIVNALDMPSRQAFVVEMVESRDDLPNAIALNSSIFNAARLIGPSLAGVLIAALGEGVCFLLNGLSYIAVVAALLAMRIRPGDGAPDAGPMWGKLKEGFAYAFGSAPIRSILLLLSLVSLVGMPYTVLMPVIAKEVLHGGSRTYGFLMAAAGVGALAGAGYLASRRSVRGLVRTIALAGSVFGAGLICFSFSRILWLSLGLMVLTGFGMMVQMASSNTVIQTIVDDDKRGRVMSFYAMTFAGMAPFGSLLAGWMAQRIGAPLTLAIGGACCIAGGVAFASRLPMLRRIVRPIYVSKGIIPEVATGIGEAPRE